MAKPIKRFHWDSVDYAQAFATLVKCYDGRRTETEVLRNIFSAYPSSSYAADWGAGSGDFTGVLLERFQQVYAIEPNAEMRAALKRRFPTANLIDGTIKSAMLPTKVDVGLISHVFYHLPDGEWGDYAIHAADKLSDRGVLVISMKTADSGCNQMLVNFGAPAFDLRAQLAPAIKSHTEFSFEFLTAPAMITTDSFADSLSIARFMFCDRDPDSFDRNHTEDEFQAYVREYFWDENSGRGGWNCSNVFCCIRRVVDC